MITDDRVNFKSGNRVREGTVVKQIEGSTVWLIKLDEGHTVVAWAEELTVLPKKVVKIPVAATVEASVKPRKKKIKS